MMHSHWNQRMGTLVMLFATIAICPQTVHASEPEHLGLAELLIATILPATNAYGDPTRSPGRVKMATTTAPTAQSARPW